jgi:hypothetical protein
VWSVSGSKLILVAARLKVWFCGRLLVGVEGSNLARGMDVCLIIVFCQVEVSSTGRSFVQRSPTVCARASVCVSLSVMKGNSNLYTYNR